jgi:hypothetical protein
VRVPRAVRLLNERKSNQVDKAWVEGIRKSWKLWSKQAASYPGYALTAKSMDPDTVKRTVSSAMAYLEQGKAFIKRLREDLLFNKGFWMRPDADGKFSGQRGKVIQLLADAELQISDGLSKVEHWGRELDPTNPMAGAHQHAYSGQQEFDRYIRTISLAATGAATNADSVISRQLLRHLTGLTKIVPTDLDSNEPDVVKVGKAVILFKDSAPDPTRPTYLSAPYGIGRMARADDAAVRHPQTRKQYIELFRAAEALLKRRGLGLVWYGEFEINSAATAPENSNGAHYGTGAQYARMGDKVVVYADPSTGLPELLIHELGHRYYYKFMTLAQRERFGEWFGQVSATSAYGSSNSVEDFAEVFSAYVMGKDLSRDQIDRLKAFLGGQEKLEGLTTDLRGLLEL